MKTLLRACMIVAVAFLWRVAALPGTTGKIAGEVKDSQTGETIIGASVVIQGTTLGAATNIEGYYVILNIPPGTYTLVASSVGYNRKIVTGVSVSVDLTTTQRFELVPEAVQAEEVVVTADRPIVRKDLTSSEARVDATTIRTLPVSEVSEVLSLQAGITQGRDGAIHIRGGRASEVAYWIDGVSVSDAYDNSQAVQVDNNSVQELQVISGTFNAEYGQAMSGIVNIVTKDGDRRFSGNLSTYTGDYVTADDGIFFHLDDVKPFANHNIEGSIGGPVFDLPLTFYLSGRYFRTDGWLYANEIINPNGTPLPGNSATFDPAGNLLTRTFVDRPTPMNGRIRRSGQGKLTLNLTGGTKISLSAIGSQIDFRDFNHDYHLIPAADVKKFDRNYNLTGLWTQALSNTSFFTMNFYYLYKQFREYLYDNPLDPRYIVDPDILSNNAGNYKFRVVGTNNHQFRRNTETRGVKLDYTDQISRLHQLKAGIEGKLHRLYLEDYNVTNGQDAQGQIIPVIPQRTGPLYEEYTEKPVEFAVYIQDKLEYERMIVNIGVRFDYFDSRGNVLADPQDPNIYNPIKQENRVDLNGDGVKSDEEQADPSVVAARRAHWYRKASAKTSISPRFGISYPITDRGVLHFSYGHFLQFPSFSDLYQKPGYKVTTASGVQGVFGNPDLSAQKTVMYEIGLQQQITEDMSFDITGFYRDTRDWTSTSAQIPVLRADGEGVTTFYTMFVNKDYANSRGITLSVNKRPTKLFSFNFSYTFQTAEGVNSSKDEEQARLQSNDQGTVISGVTLAPLDWDQTHTANLTLGLGELDWGAFIIAQYGSGLPYTPVLNQSEARGSDAIKTKNTRRLPANYNVDLRVFKSFALDPLNITLFVKVLNLLDRRNEVQVYGETGRASATPAALGIGNISGGFRVNTLEEYLLRRYHYSEPRQIQIGMDINF
ncbi:MAG: TonB-dependent receptor [Bacteroidetes bacterium]|nr:TonB-dependent receptor [Bacteroidota bacterium]MCW5896022.1 TonB-dependent receptor [Bacteroidota bacterium]